MAAFMYLSTCTIRRRRTPEPDVTFYFFVLNLEKNQNVKGRSYCKGLHQDYMYFYIH